MARANIRPHARAIRKIIAHIPGAWVREYHDGMIAASCSGAIGRTNTARGMAEVRAALEAAGYRCEANGKPGTSGQFTLDVFPPT